VVIDCKHIYIYQLELFFFGVFLKIANMAVPWTFKVMSHTLICWRTVQAEISEKIRYIIINL
jgi:hypothetical protein